MEGDCGLWRSEYFFSKKSMDQNSTLTKNILEIAIQELIAGENSQNPLSDESIVVRLQKQGMDISRRTVAKYRDQLGIPSSNRRKTF